MFTDFIWFTLRKSEHMIYRLFFLSMFWCSAISAQPGWEWEILPSMPEPVANNAVIEAYSGDSLCVYSFTGISEGLTPADIHLRSWRFNTVSQEWSALPDVDDFRGKIAAGASVIDNVIYVIGGYHVFDNFNEQTSDKLHRFDAETNQWMEDGADLPVPVDDHVQAVWRDSLIFVVTGWSQNTNVNNVQIYNPSSDSWVAGTSTPNNNDFESFGASGTIIGDTLYYYGGTQISGFSFQATGDFRKGVINPEDPTDITWSLENSFPLPDGYRMACSSSGNEILWIGGAEISYNFDAIAYNGGFVVEPFQEIRSFDTESAQWAFFENSPFPIMDLRGIAKVSEVEWIIAGGISQDQEVSDQVYLIRKASVSTDFPNGIEWNAFQSGNDLVVLSDNLLNGELSIVDVTGRIVRTYPAVGKRMRLELGGITSGVYVMAYTSEGEVVATHKIFLH